jgi:hypothetical protein
LCELVQHCFEDKRKKIWYDTLKSSDFKKFLNGFFVIPRVGGESIREEGFIRPGLPAYAGNDNFGCSLLPAMVKKEFAYEY